jgi:hypothetical protein
MITLWVTKSEIGVTLFLFFSALSMAPAYGQPPNPSFELGEDLPTGWRLSGGVGKWEPFGHSGRRCISVTGTGDDSNSWECESFSPKPNATYIVGFWMMRSKEASGGTPITGFSTVNCDLPADPSWKHYRLVARTPVDRSDTVLRFGQWHLKGTVFYDDVEVLPAIAVHRRKEGIKALGAGESISKGRYRFSMLPYWWMLDEARPLFQHTASFNTNRWVLGGPASERWQEKGAWVIYRHDPGYPILSASIRLSIGYYVDGELIIEASGDGERWVEAGRFSPSGSYEFAVPTEVLPADSIWVRLRATGILQVDRYEVEAILGGDPPDCRGESYYFGLEKGGDGMSGIFVTPLALTESGVELLLENRGKGYRELISKIDSLRKEEISPGKGIRTGLEAGEKKVVEVPLPQLWDGEQILILTISEGKKLIFKASASVVKNWKETSGFGYLLSSQPDMKVWWVEATYKVFRDTGIPSEGTNMPIRIEAAGNEYEPFQIVLSPERSFEGSLRLRLGRFEPSSPKAPIWDEIALVEYVPVRVPTDWLGGTGEYPDPLVPLWRRDRDKDFGESPEVSLRVSGKAGNQPIWITAYLPRGIRSGIYRSSISIELMEGDGKGSGLLIPVELRAFGFDLPDAVSLRTAYGIGIDNDWHRLRGREQVEEVWDLYMRTCRRYHISPYSPDSYARIRWEMEPPSEQGEAPNFRYDFSDFDRAMGRYLDEFKFNGFNFVILPEELGGQKRFSEGYISLYKKLMAPIIEHLKERGWLEKAYCYWVDEPSPEIYPDVKRGMEAIKEACPGVRRLLTINHETAPSPTFYGFVDIWVPIFHLFDPEKARERKLLGEEVWWYVCTGPKAPYPNNFIDHPAITHRIRYWMAGKWDLDGDLYWSMTYYRGKGWRPWNPWEDAQSETPEGGYWGNGDGRLLYPPTKIPPKEGSDPVIAPPIPSIRLALISEGIEDFEYISILKKLIGSGKGSEKARNALKALDRLIRSQTEYETNPKELYLERRRIAEAIEELIEGR